MASIEELQDALQRMVNSHFNMQPMAVTRIPAQQNDDDLLLHAALDELAALRAWQARAVPLLQCLDVPYTLCKRNPDFAGSADVWRCPHCRAKREMWEALEPFPHTPDCPATLVRALLAESEARDG